MKIIKFEAMHIKTLEVVEVIKVKRELGVRYIVFWKDDSEPTVYKASDFQEKFTVGTL